MSVQQLSKAPDKIPLHARPLLWINVLFFAVAFVWVCFAEVDIIIVGQGKVIKPGLDPTEIASVEATLLIEVKVLPEDIGFLRPGLTAVVKLSGYDFSIYGGLQGVVEKISADISADETGMVYHLVKVRANQTLVKKDGTYFSIIPGMGARVDFIAGHKPILDYLLEPVIRAQGQALRER